MHWEECDQQVERGDPPTLLDPGEGTSGELCSVLGSSVQDRQEATGDGPVMGHKDDQGYEASLL